MPFYAVSRPDGRSYTDVPRLRACTCSQACIRGLCRSGSGQRSDASRAPLDLVGFRQQCPTRGSACGCHVRCRLGDGTSVRQGMAQRTLRVQACARGRTVNASVRVTELGGVDHRLLIVASASGFGNFAYDHLKGERTVRQIELPHGTKPRKILPTRQPASIVTSFASWPKPTIQYERILSPCCNASVSHSPFGGMYCSACGERVI